MRRPAFDFLAKAMLCSFVSGALMLTTASADLVHKWTFNDGTSTDPIQDEVGSNDAMLIDQTGIATIAGGMADLSFNNGANSNQDFSMPTTRGAYIDLTDHTFTDAVFFGDGSSGEASVELWVTVDENRNWARLYDFGTSNSGEDASPGAGMAAYTFLAPQSAYADQPQQLATSTHSASGEETFIPTNAGTPLSTGEEHHLVVTYDINDSTAGPAGTINLYHNGEVVGTGEVNNGATPIDLSNLAEPNSWLGRAQWPDPLFDGFYNEVRIHDHELSAADVMASNAAGPDAGPDLPVVTIDRSTGQVSFANPNGSTLQLTSYQLTSMTGGLDPGGWQSIDDDGQFDPDGTWTGSTANDEISESGTGDGGTIAAGADPGPSIGAAWLPTIHEDVRAIVELNDGTMTGALVEYVGNAGQPLPRSDLTADGVIDVDDFLQFAAASQTDLSEMSLAEAYLNGDLNGDGFNNFADFRLFKEDFIGVNGAAAFASLPAMHGVVPEPNSVALLMLALTCCAGLRQTRKHLR